MTKEKLAIKLAIDIMERNVSKYINHGIYEVSDTDGAVHVEFAEAINILNEMLEQQPCEDAVSREPRKIDEWDIKGKTAELWIVNGKLQIRYQGTIHNTDLPSVTPKDDVLNKIRAEIEEKVRPINIDGIAVKSSCLGIINEYKEGE